MSTKLLVVDTETTGVDAVTAEILEIAAVVVDLSTGEVSTVIDSLVCPSDHPSIWGDCWFMQHSGLPIDAIKAAPSFSVVKPRLQLLLDRFPVTSYNTKFDLTLLRQYNVRLGQEWPCIMLACREVLKLPSYVLGSYKWPSLDEAWQHFYPDVCRKDTHRALPDAVSAAKIAYALIQRGYWKNI